MRKQALMIVLLILAMALIISACGAKQPDTPVPDPTAPSVTETQPQTEPDNGSSDGVCSETETAAPQPCPEARPWHFVVITHGSPTSKFWAVVKNGVDQAAEDMRVQVVYESPDTFDLDAMAKMIDDAVASKPDGLVVSIPDVNVLRGPIESAISAGIPVISINSGSGVAESLGVLGHFGQSEYAAGNAAGNEMLKQGLHKGLCLIQESGNTALDVRCQGFADALNASGLETINLNVETNDPVIAQQQISEALTQNPNVDGVLALGPSVGEPALAALQEKGLTGKVKLAAFDLSPTMLEAVQNGDMLFVIDQQPYLQGYLPIVFLTLYKENLSKPAAKITLTGPDFITKEDAGEVLGFSKESLR